MRIKLDENVPVDLAPRLRTLGHDVDTVADEGLTGQSDETILSVLRVNRRFLVTCDRGLADIRRISGEDVLGVLLLRLGDESARIVIERVSMIFDSCSVTEWSGYLVVATSRTIRLRKLP